MFDLQFVIKIAITAFAAVGIEEYIKNFIKTENKKIYALIMPFLTIGCYYAVERLPIWVIGGILAVGCVQLAYQTIIQGFKTLIDGFVEKLKLLNRNGENEKRD